MTAGNPLLRLGVYHPRPCVVSASLLVTLLAVGGASPKDPVDPSPSPGPAQGLAVPLGGRRSGAGQRHPGASAGRDQPGGERPTRSRHRHRHPWPWTVNAEGQGAFYDTKAEAVAAVRAMQARGVRSIDVGCGQINLMHHPDAFASLEQAFDPQANAAYAARFLKELSRADRRLAEGGGAVSLGDAGARGRIPATGAGGLAGGAAVAGLAGATPLAQAWAATIATALPSLRACRTRSRPGGSRTS